MGLDLYILFVVVIDTLAGVAATIIIVLSFFPQFQEIKTRQNSHGISPWYLLFNAFTFMFQFNGSLCVTDKTCRLGRLDIFYDHWFAFAQHLVTALCFTSLLFMSICLPNRRARPWERIASGILATAFIYLSIFHPFLLHSVGLGDLGFHDRYGVYIAGGALLVALGFQANVTYGRVNEDALSMAGLLAQAGAFTLAGAVGLCEITFLAPAWKGGFYRAGGCFVIVCLVYAAGQLVLFVLARERLQVGERFRRYLEGDGRNVNATTALLGRHRPGRTIEEIVTRD